MRKESCPLWANDSSLTVPSPSLQMDAVSGAHVSVPVNMSSWPVFPQWASLVLLP